MSVTRSNLERCPACLAAALPECLVCGSRAIVRADGLTECAECREHTFCPCEAGLPDVRDDSGGEERLA